MLSFLRDKCSNALFQKYISDEDLIENHKVVIDVIEQYVADSKMFMGAYLPCIERMARFVYTLPASEDHHHSEAGGLFEHSLNVSLNAIKSIESTPISTRDESGFIIKSETRKDASRWKLALFIATLIHDAGKVFTMNVSITKGKATFIWDPFNIDLPLYDFLSKHEEWIYNIEWIDGRGHTHEKFSPLIFPHIAGNKATQWLGREKCAMILDAITPMPSATNLLRNFVQNADHESVANDRQSKVHAKSPPAEKKQYSALLEPKKTPPRKPEVSGTLTIKPEYKKPSKKPDVKPVLKKPSIAESGNEQAPSHQKTKHQQPSTNKHPDQTPTRPQSEPEGGVPPDLIAEKEDCISHAESATVTPAQDARAMFDGVVLDDLPTLIGMQLKQMIESGSVLVNSSQQNGDKCVLGHKKCIWISWAALEMAIKKVFKSKNIPHGKEHLNYLIQSGTLCLVGANKSHVKATVLKSKHILNAMPIAVSRKTIGDIPVFKGFLDLAAFELSVKKVAFPQGNNAQVNTESLTLDDKESAKEFALLLVTKLIQAGEGKRMFTVDKSALEKVASDEGIPDHIYKQARMILRTNNVLQKGAPQSAEIKVSVSSAMEYKERHKEEK